MAELGLVLPENDLTPQDFKELARRLGRAAFVPLFLKFYERIVTGEATIEEQRKALADIGRWTGVEEDKRIDPNANLPVFNIVFGAAGTPANSMQVIEMPAEPPPLLDPAMTPEEAAGILASAERHFAEFPPLETDDAQPAARSSTLGALQDLAALAPEADRTGESAEPAGQRAPDSGALQRHSEQGLRGRDASAPRPPRLRARVPARAPAHSEAVRQALEVLSPLEDAMKTLDDALDGF